MDSYNGNGSLTDRTKFHYNSDGKLIEDKAYNSDGNLTFIGKYKLDDNGNEIEYKRYNTNGKLEYTHFSVHEKRLLIKE